MGPTCTLRCSLAVLLPMCLLPIGPVPLPATHEAASEADEWVSSWLLLCCCCEWATQNSVQSAPYMVNEWVYDANAIIQIECSKCERVVVGVAED